MLNGVNSVSGSRSRVQYAVIVILLALSLAHADSITGFTGKPAPSAARNSTSQLRKYPASQLARTGLSPLWNSSLRVAPKGRAGRGPLLPGFRGDFSAALGAQQNPRSLAERELDSLLRFFQHLVMGRGRVIESSYRGCKKSKDADTCAY